MAVGIMAILFGIMVLYIMQRYENSMEKATIQMLSLVAIFGGVLTAIV